jgi:pimeloyl-ACP methyl ester carboxylesterase
VPSSRAVPRALAVSAALVAAALIVPSLASAQAAAAAPREETFLVPVRAAGGLRVLLRHRASDAGDGRTRPPVLFVHGATFPSALAAAHRFDGRSWMDDLAGRGFDVWALDFLGYGGADRYPAMRGRPDVHPPLGRAPDAAAQIGAAVEFLLRRRGGDRVSIVAHSWGTIPAGLYAGLSPERVAHLVQFGPVAPRAGTPASAPAPAYHDVTAEAQRSRFLGYVPAGEPRVLDERHLGPWLETYLATDAASGERSPPSVRVPYGPIADLDEAWSGRLGYDPARVRAPVLIVRGEWETVTPDADARLLFDAYLRAPWKRDVKISHGTHVMHLESARTQLYDEVAAFLAR